jgi:hypothetical protein
MHSPIEHNPAKKVVLNEDLLSMLSPYVCNNNISVTFSHKTLHCYNKISFSNAHTQLCPGAGCCSLQLSVC